jgi:endogenous inhibitor of DNA gyrase (YacG/DUF329 family)
VGLIEDRFGHVLAPVWLYDRSLVWVCQVHTSETLGVVKTLFPRKSCPACGKSVRKLAREADGADTIAIAFMELPFWVLFGVCVMLGMVHWLAGVVSVAILVAAFFFWDRSKSRYECDACGKQSAYHETVR